MIKVCDAIMGSGKTSAAIAYMNEQSDKKFIFITPYLSEAERIRDSCPDLDFVEPKSTLEEFNFSKVNHTASLIAEGRNITTTHQAFKYYTAEMLGNIAAYGYTLIIDECVDVLETYEITPGDLNMLVDGGYVTRLGEVYTKGKVPYKGTAFRRFFRTLESRELVAVDDPHGKRLRSGTVFRRRHDAPRQRPDRRRLRRNEKGPLPPGFFGGHLHHR